jgi:hypothetical protein
MPAPMWNNKKIALSSFGKAALLGIITIAAYLPFFLRKHYFLAADLDYKNIGAATPLVRWCAKFYFMQTFSAFHFNASYHLAANVFLHLINVILVFYVIKKLTRDEDIALSVGLIFAVHYLAATVVLQVAMACELLSTMFCLLSFLCFVTYRTNSPGARRMIYYNLSFLFFLGSLFSRATSLIFPAIVLVYDMLWRRPEEKRRALVVRNIPFVLVSIIYLALVLFLMVAPRPTNIDNILSRTEMILQSPWVAMVSFNIIWAFFMIPFDFQGAQEAFFTLTFYRSPFSLIVFLCLLPCVVYVLIRSKNRMYTIALSWLLVFSTFFALNCRRAASDLYMYFPAVAASLLWALVIADLSSMRATARHQRRVRLAATAMVAGLLFYSTCHRQQTRSAVGQIVHDGLEAVVSRVSADSQKAVVYAFDFPLKIKRWPAFADNLFIQFKSERMPLDLKIIDYRKRRYSLPAALYMMIRPGACGQKQLARAEGYCFADDYGFRRNSSEIGVDNCFPKSYRRYLFAYRDNRVEDISEAYFPKTKVVYQVRGQGITQLSLIGDFNDWDAKVNQFTQEKDGSWTVALDLQPNLYRYQFLVNGSKAVAHPESRYRLPCPGRLACSVLLVPNTALPFGLLPTGSAITDAQIIRHKERLLLDPDDSEAHMMLSSIYRAHGFNTEAGFEFEEAQNATKKKIPLKVAR